jgi:hypothetical protein
MFTPVSRAHNPRSRVIDYIVYIAIGFEFIFITFLVNSKWGHDAFSRWFGLVGFTSCLFGFFLQESRKFLRDRRFWESPPCS